VDKRDYEVWYESFERAGRRVFQKKSPEFGCHGLLLEEVGGVADGEVMQVDSGIWIVLPLEISCGLACFRITEFRAWMPDYEALFFDVLKTCPDDLAYADEDLIVNRIGRNMQRDERIEGVFLAHAIGRLPDEVKERQKLNIQLVVGNRRKLFYGYFHLTVSNMRSKRKPVTRRNLMHSLIILNKEVDAAAEIHEPASEIIHSPLSEYEKPTDLEEEA
jgi:hypothetical protein